MSAIFKHILVILRISSKIAHLVNDRKPLGLSVLILRYKGTVCWIWPPFIWGIQGPDSVYR